MTAPVHGNGGPFNAAFGPSFDPAAWLPGGGSAEVDPLNPFGVTVDQVHALVPYRRLDTDPFAVPAGSIVVTESMVAGWITSLSLDLYARITVASRLLAGNIIGQAEIAVIGADAVANGAASYWEAAAYPERSGVNATSYSDVLWQRYLRASEAMRVLVDTWLERGGAGADAGADSGLPIYVPGAGWISHLFPAVAFPDSVRW